MKLSVQDRLLLLNTLGTYAGGITTVRIVSDLMRDLGFDEAEHKALGLKQVDGGVHWDKNGSAPKDIDVGEKAISIIAEQLKKMDAAETLTMEYLPLYERFVEEEA